MDHLMRPFDIELTEDDEVPYVSSNDYHKVPFLEYVKTKEAYQVHGYGGCIDHVPL